MRFGVMACLLLPTLAAAQQPGDIKDSYQRARRLLDEAVAAHGGPAALAAVRQIRVTVSGHEIWRTQSRQVEPPHDREPMSGDMMIDLARGRLIWTGTRSYPGGIRRAWRWVTAGNQSYYIDLLTGTHSAEHYPPAETQTGNLYKLPQWLLAKSLQNANSLRALGQVRLSNGVEVEAIAATAQGSALTIGIDPTTKLVRAVLNVGGDVLDGDAAYETEFVDYRMISGLLMPARRVERVNGLATVEYAYTSVALNYEVPDSVTVPPSGSTLLPETEPEPVQQLSDGVWAIGGSQAALVVAFQDHLMVFDAPGNAGDVLQRVATLAPNKPVRYVVPTHHHDDHAAGIKEYALAGATIVTSAANRAYFERMAQARSSIGRSIPPLAKPVPFDVVTEAARSFRDATRTVELHRIQSPHAQDMFVVWLPAERILFQADLLDVPPPIEPPRFISNATSEHFCEWLSRKGWNVRVLSGAHGAIKMPDRVCSSPDRQRE